MADRIKKKIIIFAQITAITMKRIAKIAAGAALLLISLSSCSTYVSIEPQANKEWQGKTHAEIIESYGAPDREVSDGAGGKILVYENTYTEIRTDMSPMWGGVYGFYYDVMGPRDLNTTSETHVDYAHFYVDSKGICYKVATNMEKEVKKIFKSK